MSDKFVTGPLLIVESDIGMTSLGGYVTVERGELENDDFLDAVGTIVVRPVVKASCAAK